MSPPSSGLSNYELNRETEHARRAGAAYAVVTLPHPVLASDTVEFRPCLRVLGAIEAHQDRQACVVRMKRSKWHADPFACRTIPNIPVGSSASVYNVLARPVGRLLFAGDSTIREFNGLVFGAFLSGVREAGQLLPLLCRRGI